MKKKLGYHLTRGRVSRQSQRVRGWMQPFKKTLIRHFEKYLHTMMLKLTEHAGITNLLLHKQKTRWNSDIQNFYSEILNFSPIFRKMSQFSGSACFLWRHNYVTPWPILLILVCMNRKGPYLPIDTKINFIGGSVRKIEGGGCNNPPLVRRVTKNSFVRRGIKRSLLFRLRI